MGDFIENENQTRFNLKTWKALLPFMKPVRGKLIFVFLMSLLAAIGDASIPLFTRYAVNNFVVPQTTQGIGQFTLVYFSLILFLAVSTVFYSHQAMGIEMVVNRDMKNACFDHLQQLSLSFYNTTSVGYILARLMSDTNRLSSMLAWGSTYLFWNVFYLLGIFVGMFIINWKMALCVFALIPLIVVITRLFQPRILDSNHEMRKTNSHITSAFNESINGAKTAKTLVIEDKINSEFSLHTEAMYAASMRSTRINAVYLPIVTFFGSMAVALVLWQSGIMVMQQAMDFGIMSTFIAYAIAVIEPVSQLAGIMTEVLATQVNIERVSEVLSQPCTIYDTPEVIEKYGDTFHPKPENWEPIKGDIEFEHVWFRYPDAHEGDYVLEEVNLKIPAGTVVAIVGETGAGKSTLVNLACRFFEPTKGRILIDGIDYKERSQLWLHSNLGYVQQTPHLFSGTVKDNIRYGKLDASENDILRAAKLAAADIVAERLESGYDTDVGEGGDRLSTGEKQLVSFARAIVADPPIFILDEATSSIDTETEHRIQSAISHVLEGRTAFVIAHRLSTIRSSDLILLVDEHGIAESGSHDELMAIKGQYFDLYTAMMIKDEAKSEGFSL